MDKQNMNLIWKISMAVTVVASFLLIGSELFDFDFSDSFKRIIGVLDLAAIPTMIFSSVRLMKKDD